MSENVTSLSAITPLKALSRVLLLSSFLAASVSAALTQSAFAQSAQFTDPNSNAVASRAASLGPDEQRILLNEVESYFDGVGTMQARFLQYNMDGSVYRGDVKINRPGRMLIDYDDPVPYKIVADGNFYIFVDEDLEEVSHIPLALTPANMLLRQPMNLGEELTVVDAARDSGVLYVTVAQKEAEDAGTLTLAFNEEPLALRQWTVIDAQGVVTRVLLQNPKTGVKFAKDTFTFVNPWSTREGGN
ncbi:MAG: outer-membrane lipoprotein carrier protein LolA [Alphaproteobacteria bacterium]|nr:outer-membrane lipoprotein carrier protein LolA [Alphaproteobacteria bacterium]